jgi:superfamily II DNA/RNA helicase
MARGLDIAEVKNVIHYEVPSYVQTYVHRSGRTARAGATGRSYVLVQRKELSFFHKAILAKVEGGRRCMNLRLSTQLLRPFLANYGDALRRLKELLDKEKLESLTLPSSSLEPSALWKQYRFTQQEIDEAFKQQQKQDEQLKKQREEATAAAAAKLEKDENKTPTKREANSTHSHNDTRNA